MLINYTEKQKKVVVVSDLMGSGKTSWAIQFVNQAPLTEKFIIVTPFLTEIQRIKRATVHKRKFVDPDVRNRKGTKLFSLKTLLEQGCDIITTHALFKEADEQVIDLLKLHHYTLIMDEVSEVVEKLPISTSDLQILLKSLVEVDSKGMVRWVQKDYEGKFTPLRRVIETNKVFLHNKTAILWTFPVEVFLKFKRVFVLTYLFEGQIQRYYFDLHQVPYELKSVGIANEVYGAKMVLKDGQLSIARVEPEYELIDHRRPDVNRFKDLIHICKDDKLNQLGEAEGLMGYDSFTFSKLERLDRNSPIANRIRNDLRTFFLTMNKAKANDVIWTCPKKAWNNLKPKGYANSWVASNARATNDYKDRTVLGYALNRFMNPTILQYFESQGIEVDQDLFALSELVQWVFRSAVRNGQEIQLYLPSERMRRLLEQWLNN